MCVFFQEEDGIRDAHYGRSADVFSSDLDTARGCSRHTLFSQARSSRVYHCLTTEIRGFTRKGGSGHRIAVLLSLAENVLLWLLMRREKGAIEGLGWLDQSIGCSSTPLGRAVDPSSAFCAGGRVLCLQGRSEEGRVGKGCFGRGRSRWPPYH